MTGLLFRCVLGGAVTLAVGFLVLPIVAIFARLSPAEIADTFASDVFRDALTVTLATTSVAQAIILAVGTPAAYLLAMRTFPGRSVVLTLLELPLVLPPAVAGIGLLAAFGRLGLLGGSLTALGFEVAFTRVAVVLAIVFVAGPFYLRSAVAAFGAVDPLLVEAARTLGSSPPRTFRRIALPLAASGLGAGAALSFARGIGEFGATIMFAGSLQGVTQTLTLAVYEQFDLAFDVALAIGALLVLVSGSLLLGVKLIPRWLFSTSTSPIPSPRSISS
ncbi:MAG: ABC transporter permease subunit [Thermoleophilia bacterium]|nr:ABC transporter permease subunit [Thermoleophilia bacterium]